MTKEDLIKQDLNFLEYPIWLIDDRVEPGVFTWKDRDGFTFESRFRPPSKSDLLFLMFLLSKSQKNKWNGMIIFTKYELLRGCNIAANKQWYERVDDSLKRWEFTRLMFEGTFYDGKEYKTLHFGIIDSWGIEENSQRVWVNFNPIWLSKIKNSTFFKMLNFNIMKELRSPLAVRLYEILIKNFQGRNVWKCDAMKLALKIPLKEKYASQVVKKILPAVTRVNNYVDFQIKVSVEEPVRGKSTLVFEKTEKETPVQQTFSFASEKPEDVGYQALLEILPPDRREHKTLWVLLKSYYERFGYDYVARNINYAKAKSTVNFRKFLSDSLKKDWGLSMAEDDDAKKRADMEARKKLEETERIARETKAKQQHDQELNDRAKVFISSLPPEALAALKAEAFNRLDDQNKALVTRKGIGAEMVLKLMMNKIALERMNVS